MKDFPDRYKRSILKECERLHMSKTGAGDPIDDKELIQVLSWMFRRLAEWKPSHPNTELYDNAVRSLMLAAVTEQVQKP